MDIFKEHYNQANLKYGINSNRRKKILDLVSGVENKKVLDIGCASGYLGEEIKKKGNQVIGVDISERFIKQAERVLDRAITLDIQKQKLPFEDNSFDIVIMAEFLEHLIYPEKALQEAVRVLKRDGFLIISTPNFLVVSNRIKMLLGKFKYTDFGFLDRAHIHFFTYPELKKLIGGQKLKIVQENYIPYFRLPSFLARIWPNLFAFQLIIKVKKI